MRHVADDPAVAAGESYLEFRLKLEQRLTRLETSLKTWGIIMPACISAGIWLLQHFTRT